VLEPWRQRVSLLVLLLVSRQRLWPALAWLQQWLWLLAWPQVWQQ